MRMFSPSTDSINDFSMRQNGCHQQVDKCKKGFSLKLESTTILGVYFLLLLLTSISFEKSTRAHLQNESHSLSFDTTGIVKVLKISSKISIDIYVKQ